MTMWTSSGPYYVRPGGHWTSSEKHEYQVRPVRHPVQQVGIAWDKMNIK